MIILPVLFLLGALFIPNGYGLKCRVCQANSPGSPNGCQTPAEVTCPVPNDRCFTLRSLSQMNVPNVGIMNMTMEMRNCTVGAIACTEAYKQRMCQQMNTTGGLKSCNYSCCEVDLCNDGKTSGGGLTPSKPASNVSLSCYECSPEGMGPNGTGTPLISCSAPKQRKCGEIYPGLSFDRCMTVKTTVKNPQTGALLEQETKNCSLSTMCSGNMVCYSMNNTGAIVKCNVQCCEGNLCNGVPQPTISPSPSPSGPSPSGPSSGAKGQIPPSQSSLSPSSPSPSDPSQSGPKGGQTPLAVSGILAIISVVLALLFK